MLTLKIQKGENDIFCIFYILQYVMSCFRAIIKTYFYFYNPIRQKTRCNVVHDNKNNKNSQQKNMLYCLSPFYMI